MNYADVLHHEVCLIEMIPSSADIVLSSDPSKNWNGETPPIFHHSDSRWFHFRQYRLSWKNRNWLDSVNYVTRLWQKSIFKILLTEKLLHSYTNVNELTDNIISALSAQGNQQTHDVASNDHAVENQEEKDPSDTTDSHLEDSVTWSALAMSWMNDCNLSMHASDNTFWVA